jgi:hypothetical protein
MLTHLTARNGTGQHGSGLLLRCQPWQVPLLQYCQLTAKQAKVC